MLRVHVVLFMTKTVLTLILFNMLRDTKSIESQENDPFVCVDILL